MARGQANGPVGPGCAGHGAQDGVVEQAVQREGDDLDDRVQSRLARERALPGTEGEVPVAQEVGDPATQQRGQARRARVPVQPRHERRQHAEIDERRRNTRDRRTPEAQGTGQERLDAIHPPMQSNAETRSTARVTWRRQRAV
jgi:hypothetical protein